MQVPTRNNTSHNTLNNLQSDVYARIVKLQSHQMSLLETQEQMRKRKKMREEEIRQKSKKEIVTHPINNAHWVSLAGFINQSNPDIDDIQRRRIQRHHRRQQMQENKRQNQVIVASQQQTYLQEAPQKKKKQQIPWKLMRQLRQKQVEENKARLQRIEANKREKMAKYHKY